MVNLIRNKAVQALSFSTFFQVVGISFFNIVLLLLAKDTGNETFWVALVSIAASIPGVLSMFLGRIAGKIKNKTNTIISLTLLQSIMYAILGFFFESTAYVIIIAIIINLFSDIIGILVGLLRMIIIQNKVSPELQQQTLGINQSIGLIMQPIGQSIGLAYIDMTGNYVGGSIINALTFLISAIILFLYRDSLKYQFAKKGDINTEGKQSIRLFYKQAMQVFGKITGLPIVNIVLSLILLNSLGAGVDGILNLYVLENPSISPFSFGITIVLINIVYVVGSVLGSVIVNDFFKQTSFKNLILISTCFLALLFICILFNFKIIYVFLSLFGLTYILGKSNPKLYAMLMKSTDSTTLSSILGILNSSLTIAAPIGAIGLVAGYPLIGKNNIVFVCLGIICIVCVLMVTGSRVKNSWGNK